MKIHLQGATLHGTSLASLNTSSEFMIKSYPLQGPFIKHNLSGLDHFKVYDLRAKEWKTLASEVEVVPVKIDMNVTPVAGYSF